MNPLLVVQLLDAVLMLVASAPAVALRIQAIRDEMAKLRLEGRDPTPAESDAIAASIDQRLANIRRHLPPPTAP